MAKNRKNQAEFGYGPVLKVVLLCLLIGGSAIGYVWQKNQNYRLGQAITDRENKLAQLKKDNATMSDRIAVLHSPVMLIPRAKELGLAPAQPTQVVRIGEAPPAKNDNARQLAQRPVTNLAP